MSSQWFNSKPANADQVPVVTSILRDFSAEALGELRTWLEQNPPAITVQSIIGYQTNTVRIYKKATGTLAVNNTVAETAVVDETIPGGSQGTLGIIRLTLLGDWVNTGPLQASFAWKVKFGGTTFVTEFIGTGVTAATVYPFKLVVEIANLNATDSNRSWAERWGVEVAPSLQESTANTIDTSIAQSLQVTITQSVAQAGATFTRRHYMIEFL